MKELKLTAKAIRNILNANGFEKPGTKSVPILNNRICVAKGTEVTGMTIRKMWDGCFQVWANTKHPVDDIRRAARVLEEAGYHIGTQGFQCLVTIK